MIRTNNNNDYRSRKLKHHIYPISQNTRFLYIRESLQVQLMLWLIQRVANILSPLQRLGETISADPIGHFGRYYNACNSGRQSKRDKISHFFGLPEVIHLKQQSVFKLCSYGVNEIFSISFVFMDPLSWKTVVRRIIISEMHNYKKIEVRSYKCTNIINISFARIN